MKRLVITVLIAAIASAARADVSAERDAMRRYALTLLNRDRALHGLPALVLDARSSRAADSYCEAQIRNRTTGHFTTDGLTPYMRYTLAGGNDWLSENAAGWSADYSFTTRAIHEMVLRSQQAMMAETPPDDGHRRAILDPNATHVGIGLAWQGGEFRLVHEVLRRWIDWTRPFPRTASLTGTVTASGRTIGGAEIEAIAVHHEPLPTSLSPAQASARDDYSLPDGRREYLPRMRTDVLPAADGGLILQRGNMAIGRGDFPVTNDGRFTFSVPLSDGPGIYTVVVWLRRDGFSAPFAVTNVSIRVDGPAQPAPRGSAASR